MLQWEWEMWGFPSKSSCRKVCRWIALWYCPRRCGMKNVNRGMIQKFLGDLMWWDVSAGPDDIRDVGVIQAWLRSSSAVEPVGNTSVHAFPQNELPSKENVHLFKSQILSVSRLLSPKTNPWSQNSLVLLLLRLATHQCELSRTSLTSSPQLLLSLSLAVWSNLVIFDFTSCNKHCVLKANTMLWQTICIVWRVCVSPPSTPQKLTHYIEQISLLSDAIIISQEQMLTLSITIAAFLAFSFLDIRLQIRYSFARVAPSLVKLFVLLWIIFRPIVKPNRVEEEKFPLPQGQLLASTTLPLFWGLL